VPFPKIPASKNLSSGSRLKRISRFTLDTLSPLHYQVSIGGPLVQRPHWTLSEFSLSRCRIWRPARASCSYSPAPDVLRNFLKQCKGSKGKREQKKKKREKETCIRARGDPAVLAGKFRPRTALPFSLDGRLSRANIYPCKFLVMAEAREALAEAEGYRGRGGGGGRGNALLVLRVIPTPPLNKQFPPASRKCAGKKESEGEGREKKRPGESTCRASDSVRVGLVKGKYV